MKRHAVALVAALALAGIGVAVWLKRGAIVGAIESNVDQPQPLLKTASTLEKAAWVVRVFAIVSRALPQLTTQAAMLVTAQAALESGFGSIPHLSLAHTFNLWNVTAGSSWKGQVFHQENADQNAAGASIAQNWRVYGTVDEAARDWWLLVSGGRYKNQWVTEYLQRGDVSGFINALYLAGYFELDPAKYLARFNGVLSAVQKALA